MSYLERNLAFLSRSQPELALHLRQTAASNVEVFPSAKGIPTARYIRGDTSTFLHSRYDPMKEARQLIRKTDLAEADYFILLGFGLGYVLDALREQSADPANHYFAIESDAAILKAAFDARDLSHLLCLPYLHFAWPATGPDVARQWQAFFDPVRAQKSVFISHLPSIALEPALFRSAAEMIQSQTLQIFTDINTLVARSQEFLDNFVLNLPRAIAAPGVSGFAGRFSGIPAVVVSAGPSLDKNIHEFRSCEDRVLLLSTDTALKPLLAAGVEPHFVLTGDPSYENYLHLRGSQTTTTILVAEATAYPASIEEFDTRTISCIFENSSLRALSALLGSKGSLRAWGSVATMALDFALVLGCNPILFVGQDLAHTDGRIYCSGLHFEERWFEGVHGPEEWQAVWQRLAESRNVLKMEDIFGHPIETSDKLISYWNWISKEISNHPRVRFINATEGGILKDQVAIMSLREALYRYCSNDLDLRQRVRATFLKAQETISQDSILDFRIYLAESDALARALQRGLEICGSSDQTDMKEVLQQLEKIKADIYTNSRVAPLVDCFNQMGNFTFLRRQAGLARRPRGESLANEIRTIYREYFETVRESLQRIDKALLQISRVID